MTDTQISVGMNVDGVVTGTEKAKRKISELGGAAREAGKGTGAIGDGMAGAATKVEAATKNMVGSIQRQIAALEAGDKSSRQYQESLARMRGIDTAALKPYLDQLDAVKAKQADAAASQESFASGFAAVKVGALAAAAAFGAFAIAFKGIVNGVDVLNDLKDATGASIENISALEDVALRTGGSFDTVSTSLIKLNKGLADAKPGSDMAIAINAIGLSVDDLKKLDPAEAFRKTAVALSGFADDANKARLTQELFGKSLKEVAPFLKDLAEKGELVAKVTTEQADEAERFNKSLFEMQKNVTDISRGLAGPLVTALNEVIAKFKEGSAEGKGFMSIASDRYWSNIRKFYGMEQPVVNTGGAGGEWGEDAPKPSAPDVGALAEKEKAAAKAREEAAKAATRALEEQNKALADQAKLLAELSGLTGSFSKDWADLSAIYKRGEISLDQLTEAQAKLLAKQPFAIAEAKASADLIKAQSKAVSDGIKFMQAENKAYEDHAKVLRTSEKAIEDYADSAKLMADDLVFETKLIGLNTAERERAIEQRKIQLELDKEIRRINDTAGLSFEEKESQKAIVMQSAVSKASTAAARSSLNEWAKTADSIRDSLVDAFDSAILTGKDLFTSLRDAAVKLFDGLVLRPILQGVLQPVATALTGSLIGTAANAATGQAATGGLIGSMLPPSSMGSLDIAGFTLPQIGMGIAALGILKSLGAFGSNFISATDSGRARVDYTSAGLGGAAYSTTGDATQIEAQTKSVETLAQSYFKTAAQLGIKAMQAAFEVGTNTGREGAAPQTVLGVNIGKVGYSSGEIASTDAAGLSLAASRAVLTALQASELPSYLSGVFDNITASTATQDQINATLAYAGSLKAIREALLETREPLQIVRDNVADAFASLGTSADTFKTDFVAAIDGGITGDALSSWQALGTGLDTLAADSKAAADSLAKTNRTWQDQLDILTGSETSRSLALRDATDETTKSLMRQVYAQQDLKDSTEAAIAAQKDSLSANLDAATAGAANAFAALQRAVDAQRATDTAKYEADKAIATAAYTSQQTLMQASIDRTRVSLDAVTASVGKLKSLSNSLKSTLDGMRIAGSDSAYRADAQAQIRAALNTARSGGGLPLDGQLASALSTVSKPSEQLFATFEDYARDVYKTANDISALSGLTEAQLTADELTQKILQAQSETLTEQNKLLKDGFHDQVSVLDDILSNAQKQLDAANGLDVSVLSVAAALANFNASISALAAERTAQALPTSGASKAADYMATNADVAAAYKDNTYGLGATDYVNVHFGLYGKDEGRASPVADTKAKSYFELYPDVAAAFAANSYGMTQAEYSARHYANFGKDEKRIYPGFAVGTNYVPNDMIAQIHQGEAIIPKAYNPAAGGQDNTALIAEIRALRKEVSSLKASSDSTASSTKKLAGQFETATEGGRAMQTEVYA